MNRLISFLLATLITCPAAQALDIKTDASCKKLVTAIEQSQGIEKCTAAWQNITASNAIPAQDQTAMLDQALQLAKTQKTALEQELTNLGDKTKNHSKIKWGAAQLALGAYLLLGEAYILIGATIMGDKLHYVPGSHFLWPEVWAQYKKQYISNISALCIFSTRLFLINPGLGTYSLYKGYHNLKQGLNYKQFLQDKITNSDAIIIYLQDLQTNNH